MLFRLEIKTGNISRMINKGIVLFYFLTVSGVFGELRNPLPQNQAVLMGTTPVAFNCSSNNGWDVISWSVTPVGETASRTISVGSRVFSSYSDVCEVSSAGDGINTLTIKVANESLAGTYSCNEGLASASAQLIVYNSDPVCTSNASSADYLFPGQVVQMSCTFNYIRNSPFVSVIMVWYKGSSLISSDHLRNSNSGILTTAVSTAPPQIVNYSSPFPAFQCRTSFNVTGNTATNVPSYVNAATIPEKVVKYFNPNCSIEGAKSGGNVYQGSNISCKADANPPATYRWSNSTNAALSTNPSMQIWNDGQYTCAAWNEVGSCQPNVTVNLTIYTTTLPPTTTTPTTITPPSITSSSVALPSPSESQSQSGGLSQDTKNIIIGVVVGVGGAILLAILIAIICCCMKKKNKSADNYKEDRNAKRMNDYPPPYDGHVGPQRNSSPDVVDYSPPSVYRSSYGGSSPSQPKYVGDDNLNYAQIQVDNQPRSRQPLQVPQNSNYVEVALA